MVMRDISLYLLLGHLIIVASVSACVSTNCLRCEIAEQTVESCQRCLKAMCINDTEYANNSSTCQKAFQVSINGSGSNVKEGDDITLNCVHNIPDLNLTLGWKKDGKERHENKNMNNLVLEVFSPDAGLYICYVNSSCGNFSSPPYKLSVNNDSVFILMICGVSALVLVVIMGLAMKFKMKRDNAKHKARRAQKALDGRTGSPAPFTPRES